MQRKECPKEVAVKSAEVRFSSRSSQLVSEQAKMAPKDSRTARPVQGQVRKKRILPVKALPMEEMREAAQLARSYIRTMETHSRGSQRQTADVGAPQGMRIPYEHLFNSGSMVNANSKSFPHDMALINQLQANGTLPGHMLNAGAMGAMTVNKRPFLAANAAEESRLKRLRKIVNSSTLETLGQQAAGAKYGGDHSSPLLPSPPPACNIYDSRHEDSFNYLQKSPSAHYSGDPPSPTPRKSSMKGKLTSDMRLDSSAFPSSDKVGNSPGFYDLEDKQMKTKSGQVSVSQNGSAKSAAEQYRSSLLQLHLSSLQPHTRSHMMPSFGNGEQKAQMISDETFLGHNGHDMQTGLSHLSRPELATYFARLAALRNLPQHENGTHLGSGQHQDMAHHPNSLPSNPSAGILPLPGRPEFNGSGNNLHSLGFLPPDAGILPLPGRSELAQMASLQQGLAAQAFNGSQHSLGQSVQLHSIPMQGDLASLQQELSGQRSAVGHHPLYPSHQMPNHLQYLNQELSAQRVMGNQHPLLPPLAFQNDLATLQQELSAQQFNASHQRLPMQGDLNALQQELSAQRLQNSLVQSPLQNNLTSLQHELLTQRFNAGQHQFLQSYPLQGNLALFQQDLALNGGHQQFLHNYPVQGDLSSLQQELDFQRMNGGAHPLMQASLQQQLSAQNYNGGQHPLLQTLQM